MLLTVSRVAVRVSLGQSHSGQEEAGQLSEMHINECMRLHNEELYGMKCKAKRVLKGCQDSNEGGGDLGHCHICRGAIPTIINGPGPIVLPPGSLNARCSYSRKL